MPEILFNSISDNGGLGLIPVHSCLQSVSREAQACAYGKTNVVDRPHRRPDLRLCDTAARLETSMAILSAPCASAPLRTLAHSHIQVAGRPIWHVPLWGDCPKPLEETIAPRRCTTRPSSPMARALTGTWPCLSGLTCRWDLSRFSHSQLKARISFRMASARFPDVIHWKPDIADAALQPHCQVQDQSLGTRTIPRCGVSNRYTTATDCESIPGGSLRSSYRMPAS